VKKFGVFLLLVVLLGCAKLPPEGSIPVTKRLVFTVTTANPLNPNYIYMVALNPSTDVNPTTQGPVPVVAQPWGNGFVAGGCSNFVWWDPSQPPGAHYTIYQFVDASLINFVRTSVPVDSTEPPVGTGRTLQFTIDLAQIAPSVDVANSYQNIQINLLTMDRRPQGNDTGGKNWDALGDGRIPSQINTWVTIPLRVSGVYTNQTFSNIEPTGDVADPALDIVDFSIEVRQ